MEEKHDHNNASNHAIPTPLPTYFIMILKQQMMKYTVETRENHA